ncbi:hypothetical protein B0T26DRAFT_780375 [Lasiosphaeria miniovina]|uniref:Uncharacterized protein n=1 Tax=Lasiosphaeria miniovina TaxID=1954250 RepID=A0AA40ABL5_9PEZI|nr:uncharacterized protein B0T26DRAFT_780375 [Lasiosphaeria miniovina]KAK0712735.1 hypothetical protein B0T26DRAFT_780375 [Lasiosphaeria miniovina]
MPSFAAGKHRQPFPPLFTTIHYVDSTSLAAGGDFSRTPTALKDMAQGTRDWPSGGAAKILRSDEARATISKVKRAFDVRPKGQPGEVWENRHYYCLDHLVHPNNKGDDGNDDDGGDGDDSTDGAAGKKGKCKAKATPKKGFFKHTAANEGQGKGQGRRQGNTRQEKGKGQGRRTYPYHAQPDPCGFLDPLAATRTGSRSTTARLGPDTGSCKHHKLIRDYEDRQQHVTRAPAACFLPGYRLSLAAWPLNLTMVKWEEIHLLSDLLPPQYKFKGEFNRLSLKTGISPAHSSTNRGDHAVFSTCLRGEVNCLNCLWAYRPREEIREDLFEAVMQVQGPLTKEQHQQIVEIMQAGKQASR